MCITESGFFIHWNPEPPVIKQKQAPLSMLTAPTTLYQMFPTTEIKRHANQTQQGTEIRIERSAQFNNCSFYNFADVYALDHDAYRLVTHLDRSLLGLQLPRFPFKPENVIGVSGVI